MWQRTKLKSSLTQIDQDLVTVDIACHRARGRETAKRGGALIDGRVAGRCSNLRLGTRPDRPLKQPESTQAV
jgi:hypothetical protein